jgi:uncharacterized protein YpbB
MEYSLPQEFSPHDYPFELRGQVARFLNTHFGKYTIPQIAAELQADEDRVAWVLSNLVELTNPEVVMGNAEGEEYWRKSLKLKSECPKTLTDATVFYGRIMT